MAIEDLIRRDLMVHLDKIAAAVKKAGLLEVGIEPDMFPRPSVRFALDDGDRNNGDGFISIDDDGGPYGIHWLEWEDDENRSVAKSVMVTSMEELAAKLEEVRVEGARAFGD